MDAPIAQVSLEDLGPANDTMFCLMSGLQVGTLLYIGSRNVSPTMVIVYDLERRRVVARHDLGSGKFVQALAVSPDRATVYAGIVHADPGDANLYGFPAGAVSGRGRPLGRMGDLLVRSLSVAPDGVVYAVGHESGPGLWSYDPRTGGIRRTADIDPGATGARSVCATADTVFVGTGSELAGADASGCGLFAVRRNDDTVTSIRPDAFDTDVSIRDLLATEDRLFVGTVGAGGMCRLAVMSLDDLAVSEVYDIHGASVGCFHRTGDTVFAAAGELMRYDMTRNELAPLPFAETSERWALGHHDDRLIVLLAAGMVAHIDMATGEQDEVDLIDAGAPALPQLGMSIAAGAHACYIAGNGGVARHDLNGDRRPDLLRVPGEAKHMDVVGDDELYMAVYNSKGIWRSRSGERPRQVAGLPPDLNRPQDTAWDEARGLFLAVGENDKFGGGFLCGWSPDADELYLHHNPLGSHPMVRAVCADADAAYIGGWNRYAKGPVSAIAAMDPVSGEQAWFHDFELGSGISCIAVLDEVIVGLSVGGELFAADRSTGRLRTRRNVSELVDGLSRIIVNDNTLIAGSADAVFTVTPNLDVDVLIDDLDGQWYSGPSLAADPAGRLYTLRGRHLVRFEIAESR